ncbi:MAG: alpha amylase N-terminal ig-like domain-containing protein, partial [Fimbriimonadales bacterium]
MKRRFGMGWLIALVLVSIGLADEPRYDFTFRLTLETPAEAVYLAGSFNDWQPRLTRMRSDDGGRTWTLTLPLPPGAHQYKFVINGTDWRTDPNAPTVDDGNGNLNSVVWVEPDGYNRPAQRGDAQITRSGLIHNPDDTRDRYVHQNRLYLRVRTRKDDVEAVDLVLMGRTRRTIRMEPFVDDALYTYYQVSLPNQDLNYYFVIRDGRARLALTPSGVQPVGNRLTGFQHRKGEKRLDVPTWVQDAIFYQIMPDRFFNADPTNDPANDQPIDFTGRMEGDRFYGGDLKGIIQKLGYLQDLGITTLYLTPVFASVTHHNYDTDDYEQVDPQLGTNEDLKELARLLRTNQMRLVLDGVFNHVGIYFFAFQDLLKNQENSAYKDWFIVERFPVRVEPNPTYWAWWNIPYMPKLRHENSEVRAYLFRVVEQWTKTLQLDGWRLDVPNEVPDFFWQEFRPVVRRANPEAVIIGEIWDDAGRWLQGDMFDSVMNYVWRGAVLDWIAHRRATPSQFDQRMRSLIVRYPRPSLYAMYNMLSSHDVPRFWRECQGDERRVRLGFLIMMTGIGAPALYYGDEVGLDGGGTPDNRRPMIWEPTPQQEALRNYVRRLIQARQRSAALRRGDWRTLLVDDTRNCYSFARIYEGQAVVVAINNGSEPATLEIASPTRATEWTLLVSTHDDFVRGDYPVAKGRLT